MNIEHLKGKQVRCTSDTAVINPEYIKDSWYDVVSDGDHFWIGKIGGWRLKMDNLDYDYFDLANPRTPIDTDKMLSNYQLMYKMLEGLSYEAKLYEHERYTIQQFLETVKID